MLQRMAWRRRADGGRVWKPRTSRVSPDGLRLKCTRTHNLRDAVADLKSIELVGRGCCRAPKANPTDLWLRARVDSMEEQLKNVHVLGCQWRRSWKIRRARANKLKEDVGRLERASADDWWDISAKRVSEYIERVERSVERLDNDKK